MREVERALEGANLIVQRVETENDIGRDAWVDIVEGTDVTGGVVALQVKSGSSFLHGGRWVVPGKPADFTLWRESTVPMFGIVHDPDSNQLRWTNLSAAATAAHHRRRPDAYDDAVVKGPYGQLAVTAPDENRLDLDVGPFLAAAQSALRQQQGSIAYNLLSSDSETVEIAVVDCFAMGRREPQAFLLLAALFSRLPLSNRPLAVKVLALATHHPDVFWTRNNWISSEIKDEVARQSHWTDSEVALLLELVVSNEGGIERGSFGQDVYQVLRLDAELDARLFHVATNVRVGEEVRFWAAAIMLYHAGDDASSVLHQLLVEAEDLNHNRQFGELVSLVQEFGYVSMF